MAKQFKRSAIEAVPHLTEYSSGQEKKEDKTSGSGVTKRFKASAVKAIEPKRSFSLPAFSNTLPTTAAGLIQRGQALRRITPVSDTASASLGELDVEKERVQKSAADTGKELRLSNARENLARRAGFPVNGINIDQERERQSDLSKELQGYRRDMERIDYIQGYQDVTREDNFVGQFRASYDIGQMGQDEAMAWKDYLSNPTPQNRLYAEAVSKVREDYIQRNQAALDDNATLPWISQDLAQYLPQLKGQTIAGAKGALGGAAVGTVIPVAGTAAGAKAGYVAGRAAYGFDTMQGFAFKSLLDAGLDEQTAREAAMDEAFISSLIEGGDAAIDLLTLGGGKVISALFKKSAQTGAKITKPMWKQILSGGAAVLGNALGEGAQEWVQEGVSLANQNRGSTGALDLIGATGGQVYDALSGRDPDALAQMNDAGAAGFRIGLMVGGGSRLTNAALERAINRQNGMAGSDVEDMASTFGPSGSRAFTNAVENGAPATGIYSDFVNAYNSGLHGREMPAATSDAISAGQMQAAYYAGQNDAGEKGGAPKPPHTTQGSERTAAGSPEERPVSLLEQMRQQSDTITNRQAEQLMDDQAAMETLRSSAGLEITAQDTMSKRRSAVKQAFARYALSQSVQTVQAVREPVQTAKAAQNTLSGGIDDSLLSSFGENGQKAFVNSVRNSTSPEDIYPEFSRAYVEGLTGAGQRDGMSEVSQAAYYAGQNDAAASLASERAAVGNATVYRDAGFVPNEYSADLDQDTVNYLDAFAKATGTRIQMAADTGEGGANGWYRDGTIYIATDADKPAIEVAKHEITHRLQEIAPEEYRQYRDYAVNALAARGASASDLVELYRARYAEAGVDLTTEQAMDEIAADFTETLVVDPARFTQLSQDNRSVARKLLDAIKHFISKVKSAFSGSARRNAAARETFGVDLGTLEKAARLWEQALGAGAERVRNTQASSLQTQQADATMGNTRYSMKEEQEYGRAREESREEFRQRWGRGAGSGFTVIERGPYACAYRGVARVQESAAGVRQSLQSWGIDSVIVDGPVYVNKDGVTTARSVREAATLQGMVFVSNDTTIPPRDTAGHEAYHAWKGTGARLDYTDMIRENLNYGSKEFLTYQQKIADAYFGGDVDLSDVVQLRKFEEELFAYISGHLNSGDYESVLRAMFRDYDAVKAAWETLVRENGAARGSAEFKQNRYSLKEDDNGQKAGTDRADVRGVGDAERGPRGGRKGAAAERGSGQNRSEVRGGQISFGSRSSAEKGRLTEILITPLDNDPQWINAIRSFPLDDVAQTLSNNIDRNTAAIQKMMREIPGFAKAVADARAYANRGKTVRGRSIGTAVENATNKDSFGRTLSKEQQAYFSGSAARDPYGNLLRLFHGSRTDVFTEFDLYEGVWLTEDRNYAKNYADLRSPESENSELEDQVYSDDRLKIFEVYADIRNPVDLGEINDVLTAGKIRELAKILGVRYNELRGIAKPYMNENIYSLTRSREFIDLVGRQGFDGMMATEGGVETWCAIGSPDQVKLTGNETPTADPDIRYSLKGTSQLQRQVQNLEERNRYLQEQMKRTKGIKTDRKKTASFARDLLTSYESQYDQDTLTGELLEIYDEIANSRDGVDIEGLRTKAREVAERVLEQSVRVDAEVYNEYSSLRNYLRTTRIKVPKSIHADLEPVGGYNGIRRGNSRRLKLSATEGMDIDTVYCELSQQYPGLFDEQAYTNPADQIINISDVLESIQPVVSNPYSTDMEMAARFVADEILEGYFDVPQQRPTFADRQEARIEAARAAGNRRLTEQRERDRRQVEELRQQNRDTVLAERMAAGRESAAMRRRYDQRIAQLRQQAGSRYKTPFPGSAGDEKSRYRSSRKSTLHGISPPGNGETPESFATASSATSSPCPPDCSTLQMAGTCRRN